MVTKYRFKLKPDGQKAIKKTVYATSLESAYIMIMAMENCPRNSIKSL